jgi:hypothetical protein
MSNLTHYFFIVDDNFVRIHCGELLSPMDVGNKKTVTVHDDIILFIYETLKWIESYDYKDERVVSGLYYDGISYIHNDQLYLFSEIVDSWVGLFRNAPKSLLLNKNSAKYKASDVEAELVQLNKLISEANKIKQQLILHLGI